jgi:hypothetical protein
MVADAGLTETVLTGGGGAGFTVIVGVVAAGADSLIALIVAVPAPAAVTVTVAPLAVLTELETLTVSTAVLLDTQLTVRPLSAVPPASLGVAVRICVAPNAIGVTGVDRVKLATGTGFTVIALVPLCPSLVAVIVTGPPAATPVTRPFASTVATKGAPEIHATARPVSTLLLASRNVAVSCRVAPTMIVAESGETLTNATGGGGTSVTVIELSPDFPSLVATIAIGPPTSNAVTSPFASTRAVAGLSEAQVTTRPARTFPAMSLSSALSCSVPPTTIVAAAGVTVTVFTGAGGTG